MLLYPIWLVLAAVFFTFAVQHWRLSQREIRPFRVREGEWTGEAGDVLRDFAEDYNRYLDQVNSTYRDKHRVEMVGYLVTGILALVSMILTLPT